MEKHEASRIVDDLAQKIAEIDPGAMLELCDHFDDELFEFKLHTARSSYRSLGNIDSILERVAHDKQARDQAACPFCKAPLSRLDCCDSCGAIGRRSGEALAEWFLARVHDPDLILAAIANEADVFREDDGLEGGWCRLPQQPLPAPLATLVRRIIGPMPAARAAPIELPLIFLADNLESEQEVQRLLNIEQFAAGEKLDLYEGTTWLPDCRHCRHGATLRDHRAFIHEHDYFCVYPVVGADFERLFPNTEAFCFHDGNGFELHQEGSRYKDFPRAQFFNALKIAWLDQAGHYMDPESADYHGFAGVPLNTRHGPVCPGFVLNPGHDDFAGGVYQIGKAKIPVRFGPP